MRSTSRIVGVSINTVTKLMLDAGAACQVYHDQKVRNLLCQRVQCDEIWSFCYAKRKNADAAQYEMSGDVWTWTALDADTKLLIAWRVGARDTATAIEFVGDVERRIANRVQLSTDGHFAYMEAVDRAFGGAVDFGQLVKQYDEDTGRYTGSEHRRLSGDPVGITTAHVERHNLTMRMSMRRFTRRTNAFSKKRENHAAMQAIFFVWYNLCLSQK